MTGQKQGYTVIRGFTAKTSAGEKDIPVGVTLMLTSEKAAALIRRGVVADRSRLLIRWRTGTGRVIYLSDSAGAADFVPPGTALFSLEELAVAKGIGRQAADRLIDIKEVFPCCKIVGIEKTGEEKAHDK